MRFTSLLPLALAASSFVIPDAETARSLRLETQEPDHPFWDNIKDPEKIWEDLEHRFKDAAKSAKHTFDDAIEASHEAVDSAYDSAVDYTENLQEAFAGKSWINSAEEDLDLFEGPPEHPPHHGPPGHGKPPHKKPHHPHHKSNKTVYELIAESKYTTKLAKLINEFPDLVEALNGTKANYTVFAPTDRAFEKIPEHAPKPSKEFLKKLLSYHVSPEFYPAGRVLVTRTVPTILEAEKIGKVPQRLSTQIGLRGLTVNFYSRIVAIDIFGTNGVIHGVDSILIPPPKVVDIISFLPGEFSTLELALYKTGLYEYYNNTGLHNGGTLFAPTNFAFKLLGPRINAFLFSKYGEKYLKALILYHSVPQVTLYSDAIYKIEDDSETVGGHDGCHRIPKGFYHIDLETGLEGKSLSVDIARYGRLITIKINGFTRVSTSDGIAADGVIHTLNSVLIPPKTPGGPGFVTEDMELEEFMERLSPYVTGDDEEASENVFEFEL